MPSGGDCSVSSCADGLACLPGFKCGAPLGAGAQCMLGDQCASRACPGMMCAASATISDLDCGG
jgi:hypothetical protein